MANSFVGTRSYMSPERLEGNHYSIQSDIWSLGLSLMEMALGRYPIPPPNEKVLRMIFGDQYDPQKEHQHLHQVHRTLNTQHSSSSAVGAAANSNATNPEFSTLQQSSSATSSSTSSPLTKNFNVGSSHSSTGSNNDSTIVQSLSIFDQLKYIVSEPAPTLPISVFSVEFKDFIDSCLKKNPSERPDLNGLMVHSYIRRSEMEQVEISKWICSVMNLKPPPNDFW